MSWRAMPGLFPEDQPTPAEEAGPHPAENRALPTLLVLRPGGPPEELAGAAGAAKPQKASDDCAKDVLRMLYRRGRRMTVEELVAAFAASGREYPHWSQSTVQATCSFLKNAKGALDNVRNDSRGRGYGLLVWHEDPCQED